MDRVQRAHVFVLLASLDVASVRRCGRDHDGSTGVSPNQTVSPRNTPIFSTSLIIDPDGLVWNVGTTTGVRTISRGDELVPQRNATSSWKISRACKASTAQPDCKNVPRKRLTMRPRASHLLRTASGAAWDGVHMPARPRSSGIGLPQPGGESIPRAQERTSHL
jgi:hypothetical protein